MGCLTCAELKDKYYVSTVVRKMTMFFENNPCMDCGETDIEVLTFLDEDTIFNMLSEQESWTKIAREVNKRQAICANCRRKRIASSIGPWGLPTKKWE